MAQRRATAAGLGFSPAGKRQAAFTTRQPNADLAAQFPDNSKTFYAIETTREDVNDCTGEELRAKILTGQIGTVNVEFDVSVDLLAIVSAYGCGVAAAPTGTNPYVHQIDELPPGVYTPPAFTLIHFFRNGGTPLVLVGCVLNSFTVRKPVRGKLTAVAQIRFATAEDSSGYSIPACVNYTALRAENVTLTKGATDLTSLLRTAEYSFSNNILTGDYAYITSATTPSRLDRADRRTRALKFGVFADDRDQIYLDAKAGAEDSFVFTIAESATHYWKLRADKAVFELDGGTLTKDGEANETVAAITATPLYDSTLTHTPTDIEVKNAVATTYLTASS